MNPVLLQLTALIPIVVTSALLRTYLFIVIVIYCCTELRPLSCLFLVFIIALHQFVGNLFCISEMPN